MKLRFAPFMLALLATAAFALSTTTASAQTDTCCLRIANSTTCHITICITLPDGSQQCELITQLMRTRLRFPCSHNLQFTATGACGVPTTLVLNQCVRMYLRGTGCCALVCLRLGLDGCYEITVDDAGVDCPC